MTCCVGAALWPTISNNLEVAYSTARDDSLGPIASMHLRIDVISRNPVVRAKPSEASPSLGTCTQ